MLLHAYELLVILQQMKYNPYEFLANMIQHHIIMLALLPFLCGIGFESGVMLSGQLCSLQYRV